MGPTGRTRVVVVVGMLAVLAACADEGERRVEPRPDPSTTAGSAAPSGAGPGASADCGAPDGEPETLRYRDLPGVDPERVSLDVYRRAGSTDCPALVWVHGGGWRVGDKSGAGVGTKVDLADGLGATLVPVNYRLATGDALAWPAAGEDVAAAVAWVRANAGDLGIDPDRVALVGHSAGAHLVSIVGTNPRLLGDVGAGRDDVTCVVALDGAAYRLTPGQVARNRTYRQAFGSEPDALADASPITQAEEHPGALPAFLVVTRGAAVRTAVARQLADAVEAAGGRGDVLEAQGYSHADVNRRLGEAGEQVVTPPVTAFLQGCLDGR